MHAVDACIALIVFVSVVVDAQGCILQFAGRMTEAWVTLATSDGYAVGALVLAHSLKVQQTTKKLHCMITTGVSEQLRFAVSE